MGNLKLVRKRFELPSLIKYIPWGEFINASDLKNIRLE